jgi:hypothetical protein
MAITTTWKVNNLERSATDGGVVTVHWSLTATDEATGKSAFYGDFTKFTPDASAPDFVPFESLTEATVLGWVHTELGDKKAEIEADRTAKVQKQLAPEVVSGTPW